MSNQHKQTSEAAVREMRRRTRRKSSPEAKLRGRSMLLQRPFGKLLCDWMPAPFPSASGQPIRPLPAVGFGVLPGHPAASRSRGFPCLKTIKAVTMY